MSRTGWVRRRTLGVLVILAVVAAGCGGDGDEPETAAPSTSTTTVAGDGDVRPSDDRELAESVVIRESDLPRDVEWTSAPFEEDPEGGAQLRRCLGLPPEEEGVDASSPTFSAGDVTRVDSSAIVTPDADTAARMFDVLTKPRFVDCVREQFDAQLRDVPAHVGPATTERIDFPTVGDGTSAARLSTFVETTDGGRVPLFVDVVVVRQGRVAMTLTLMNAPEPFPTDVAVALAETMAERA